MHVQWLIIYTNAGLKIYSLIGIPWCNNRGFEGVVVRPGQHLYGAANHFLAGDIEIILICYKWGGTFPSYAIVGINLSEIFYPAIDNYVHCTRSNW